MGCGASTQQPARATGASAEDATALPTERRHVPGADISVTFTEASESVTRFDVGMELFASESWADARAVFRAALSEGDPRVVRLHNGIGLCCFFLGELESAVASFDRSLEVDPENENAMHNRANAAKVLAEMKAGAPEPQQGGAGPPPAATGAGSSVPAPLAASRRA